MDENARCENCKWHKLDTCRRHAPVYSISVEMSHVYTGTKWPRVSDYDHCGDFEYKDDYIPEIKGE